MITYEPLRTYLASIGRTVHYLRAEGLINSNAARAIAADEPITLNRIIKICCHLGIPVEQAIEIKCDN